MKFMSSHIPYEKLADLAEGIAPVEEQARLQEHISTCSDCASQLIELEKVTGLMRNDRAEDAPRNVIQMAVSLFGARTHEPGKSFVKRVLAALTFDSAEMAPALGVRSGVRSESRQLLYHAGDADLDIRVTPSDDRWVVSGQILRAETLGEGNIELEGATAQVSSALNDLSEFTLPPVPRGSYTLRLRLTDMEIEVPGFNLGA